MKRSAIYPSIPALVFAGATALPVGSALAASSKSHIYKGPTENTQYGPVQVSIVVKSKKITQVNVSNSPDSARGQIIQGQAIPILKQETLKAQSANVNLVSGATQTSEGYIQSLQAAVKAAHKAKALK
jgi:uncharacterized protein with FMN-binding domain